MRLTQEDWQAQQEEIGRNYAVFVGLLPDLLANQHKRDRWALIQHRQIIEFFDTPETALGHGSRTLTGPFSVHQVTEVTDRVAIVLSTVSVDKAATV